MKTPLHLTRVPLTAAGLFLGTLATLPAGEVGPMASYAPPAPDCDACNQPGFYLNAAALYLNSASERSGYDGDWDLGGRLGVGFERPDGLFYEIEGFWWEGDADNMYWPGVNYDVEHIAIDFLIGDNLHCGEACLDVAFGLRYGSYERGATSSGIDSIAGLGALAVISESYTDFDFDGWGPTIQLDGIRRLGGPWSLYGELQQSILFGEAGGRSYGKGGAAGDTLAFISEIAAGVQYDLGAAMGGLSGAHVRLGGEAQYWSIDGNDLGLYGASLGVGFSF
ncbi:MAG: hypothetical protein HKN82_06025 [Akkermansiaceae bacterium]|nr:hypothetical protein [Akkermansiaceae bacterium]